MQPQLSDEALAAQVAQRDVEAFGLLYDRYARSVYVLAAHLLGQGEAEDLVQEVFLRLWGNAGAFDPTRGAFKSWFMAVARYRVLNHLRRRSRQPLLLALDEIEGLLDSRTDVEQQALMNMQSQAALVAVRNLPAEQRRVLVMAYFGGLSQSAIAKHLSCPIGTVKSRMRLGLQKLRAALALNAAVPTGEATQEKKGRMR